MKKPNILYLMCDQLRFDCLGAAGNVDIKTPNLDRLARRGILMQQAYSSCPVCVPARYTIRSGREPATTGSYMNEPPKPLDGQPENFEERCGPYLARTLKEQGYRTFGIGKFHTVPDMFEDVGFEVHLHTEEHWDKPDQRQRDAYASFIANQHPEFDFIEQLHGERTNMYYVPQMSPLPAELTVESYVADQAVLQLQLDDDRPWFGMVSMIGPHPPCAPPQPYNRLYDPDQMKNPVRGDIQHDHYDEMIPFMNHMIWAEDINDSWTRNLKSRYYGEITYIDACIGRILDAVDQRPDADNTLIAFFADHGDHLGDHHAWQKESFFEASCHVPMLISWPAVLPREATSSELSALVDLFALASGAAGCLDCRDGIDLLGLLRNQISGRSFYAGTYGRPDGPLFKMMIRQDNWKYIYMMNGGREQLFDLTTDPDEIKNLATEQPCKLKELRHLAVGHCRRPGLFAALDSEQNDFRSFPHFQFPKMRIKQFDHSRGVKDFAD